MKSSILSHSTSISLKQLQDFLIVHQKFSRRLKYHPNKQDILSPLALLKFNLCTAENRVEDLSEHRVSESTPKATRG